jgi:hypothetical protein
MHGRTGVFEADDGDACLLCTFAVRRGGEGGPCFAGFCLNSLGYPAMSQVKIEHMELGVKCFDDLELFQISRDQWRALRVARTRWQTERRLSVPTISALATSLTVDYRWLGI